MARLSPGSSAVPRTLASLATPTIFTHRFWKISGSSMKSVSYLHIRGSPRHFLSPAFSGRGSISPLPSCSFPHCICQFKRSPVAVTNDPNPRGLQQPVRGGSAEICSTPSSLQDPAGPEQTTPPRPGRGNVGSLEWLFTFCSHPAHITSTRFHWRKQVAGASLSRGSRSHNPPSGMDGTILTIHNLSHHEASHPGPLVHPSCFTGVGKRAQRHEAICLRSHSSPWKTSSVGAGPRRDRSELNLAGSF